MKQPRKPAKLPVRRAWTVGLLSLILMFAWFQTARAADKVSPETAIVWVADVSGSMPEIDPHSLWVNAVSLAVDIAPENSQLSFIAVNDAVQKQTALLDVAQADNAAAIKQAAQTVKCTGYTDFSVGLSAALQTLNVSPAKEKDIFFIGDISESGFLLPNMNDAQTKEHMAALTEKLAAGGIRVHLIFLRQPTSNQQLMPLWTELAAKTGGEITNLNSPAELQKTVESLYFANFAYNKTVTSSINTTAVGQEIPINIPSFALQRIRIYVAAAAPLPGIQARADSTQLTLSRSSTYDVINLAPPLPKTVTLTLPPGPNNSAKVYLLADGKMTLTSAVDSSVQKNAAGGKYQQQTMVSLTPLLNSNPLFGKVLPADASWTLTAAGPNGQVESITTARYNNGSFVYDMYPQDFGDYNFSLTVTSQGLSLSAQSRSVIKLQSAQKNYAIWIASIIGALLILAAILLALLRRRRDLTAPGAPVGATVLPEEETAGVFAGKLDIYGVLVDGGKGEIPATSYRLAELAKGKSTTLAFVMQQAGVPYQYPAAAHIRLSPGANYTLVVQNGSDAAIYCGGQMLHRGQRVILDYGQKMRVIFAENVNEYEIYYHNAVRMAVSGNRIHMEFDNE